MLVAENVLLASRLSVVKLKSWQWLYCLLCLRYFFKNRTMATDEINAPRRIILFKRIELMLVLVLPLPFAFVSGVYGPRYWV